MPASPFLIPIGSGAAAAAGVGNKAALLDRARRAGLPVPEGYVLLAQSQGKLAQAPPFKGKIAVRSAFSAEDHPWESLAGFFLSKLWVDPRNPEELRDALNDVWQSAARRAGEFRRDILLLDMVQARYAGVAFTEREYEDDLVNWTRGTGERLVAGQVPGESLELPKLRAGERSSLPRTAANFAPRLQGLLRDVRRVFGPYDWDVEWADDGRICWLLQIRPVTRPTRRNETFTLANHKEILPPLPSKLMTGVIAAASPDLFAYYREFDEDLPAERLFVEVFEGRPLINLSLLRDMMRHLGLPTRLVTDNIGGGSDQDYPLNIRRLASNGPTLLKMFGAQLGAARASRRRARNMMQRASRPSSTLAQHLEDLRWCYVQLVHGMFGLTAAMSAPLAILRRAGVLEAWNARLRTAGTEMYLDLADLSRRFPGGSGPGFDQAWSEWLDRHGHRGVYESDIARPRFREEPAPVLAAMAKPALATPPRPRLTLRALLFGPVWAQAATAMRAREQFRSDAMKAFAVIRKGLLDQASRRGVDPQSLWMLAPEEATRIDDGWRPSPLFLRERMREISDLEKCRLPDLVRRFDDFSSYYEARNTHPAGARIVGLSLTAGQVEGRAWVLDEPAFELPAGFTPENTILVAPAVDAGWIPTFTLVAGVAVETGGDLSHGSIILREIGIPAITNAARVTQTIASGCSVSLNSTGGWISIKEASPADIAAE